MASKRIAKVSIDWADLAGRVPATQKSEYLAFKARSDAYERKMMAFPKKSPTIDWSYYKKNASDPSVVESLEKQFSSYKIPYPSADNAFATLDEMEKTLTSQIEQFKRESNARIAQYEKDLDTLKNTIHIDDMTIDEFAQKFPFQECQMLPLQKPFMYPNTRDFNFADIENLDEYRHFWKVIPKSDVYHPY